MIEGWIAAGRMAPVDPRHLVFTLWAVTQTYADFEAQIRAVLGREAMDDDVFQAAGRHVTGLILRGCGLKPPRGG